MTPSVSFLPRNRLRARRTTGPRLFSFERAFEADDGNLNPRFRLFGARSLSWLSLSETQQEARVDNAGE